MTNQSDIIDHHIREIVREEIIRFFQNTIVKVKDPNEPLTNGSSVYVNKRDFAWDKNASIKERVLSIFHHKGTLLRKREILSIFMHEEGIPAERKQDAVNNVTIALTNLRIENVITNIKSGTVNPRLKFKGGFWCLTEWLENDIPRPEHLPKSISKQEQSII